MADPFTVPQRGKRETSGMLPKSERRVSGGGDTDASPYGTDTRNVYREPTMIHRSGRNVIGGGERKNY